MRRQSGQVSDRLHRAGSLAGAVLFLFGGLSAIWIVPAEVTRQLAAKLVGSYLLAWVTVFLFADTGRAELRLRFLLMNLAIAAAIVALEALPYVARVEYSVLFNSPFDYTNQPWLHPTNVFDEELHWRRKPDLRITGRLAGNIAKNWCLPNPTVHSYDLRYDAHGFRNSEDVTDAPITVVGDSFIEAVNLSEEETLQGRLAQLAGTRVASIGLSGYGPQQELAALRRFGPARTEVVVWAFYEGNDIRDLWNHEARTVSFRQGRLPTERSARQRSFSENALRALLRRMSRCSRDPEAIQRYGYFETADDRNVRMYFFDQPRPQNGDIAALPQLKEVFSSAHEAARARGARLIILYIPAKYRVYADVLRIPHRSDLWKWESGEYGALLEEMVADIDAEIGFVDVTAALASAAAEGKVLYYPDDIHWTAEGSRVAAEVLYDYIVGEAFAEPASDPT